MDPQDDPEKRIRDLERPLADSARASELGSQALPPQPYPGGAPPPPPPPTPWTYGGPVPGPPPRPSTNRIYWILGTVTVVGMLALAGGIAAFAAHQLSGVRSIVESPPTTGFSVPPSAPGGPGPSPGRTKTSRPSATPPVPSPGGNVSVSGINENRTIACSDNTVSVSGVANTVVITGHCTRVSVSGMQNAITVEAVDAIDASGLDNKVTYHSGAPKISNSGSSNVVQQG